VGCACFTFLEWSNAASLLPVVLLLSTVAAFVRTSVPHYLGFGTPALTIGFNLAVTFYFTAVKNGFALAHGWPKTNTTNPVQELNAGSFFLAVLLGVSQFMFIDTLIGGLICLAAFLIASRKATCAAYTGSLVATCVAWLLLQVPDKHAIAIGLYGYNSAGVLCLLLVFTIQSV
jgi:urea transporter